MKVFFTSLLSCLLLVSCSNPLFIQRTPGKDGAPTMKISAHQIKPVKRIPQNKSKHGNPGFYIVDRKKYFTLQNAKGYREKGTASWYGTQFHGKLTSSREPYDMLAMTAAHKTLPLPTYARVTNLKNGRSIIVKINDRGPFVKNRIIDLSYGAAIKLGMDKAGTAPVEVVAIAPYAKPYPKSELNQHFLQLASFRSKNLAKNLKYQVQLKTVHDDVFIQKVDNWYTVRLGPFGSRGELINVQHELKTLGFGSGMAIKLK